MNFLQELWDNDKCPIINGIIFRNGIIMPIEVDRSHGTNKRVLRKKESILLAEVIKQEKFLATFYTEMCSASDEDKDLQIIAGGAGMGGDGFVALLRLSKLELQWIAFFDYSNPFIYTEIVDASLSCKNNLGEVWLFPLADPANVAIVKKSEH